MLERKRPRDALLLRSGEGGEARGEKGANVVDGCGRVEVGTEEAFGVGSAVVSRETVDVVAAAGREGLGGARRREGEDGPEGGDLLAFKHLGGLASGFRVLLRSVALAWRLPQQDQESEPGLPCERFGPQAPSFPLCIHESAPYDPNVPTL